MLELFLLNGTGRLKVDHRHNQSFVLLYNSRSNIHESEWPKPKAFFMNGNYFFVNAKLCCVALFKTKTT